MTKEITKAIILQELQDKFKLRDFDPAKFLFDETVVPIYNIEPHLKHWKSGISTISISSTGAKSIVVIPSGERWTLSRYDVVFMTGTYTVAGVYTHRAALASGYFCYLDLGAAKSTSYHINLPIPLVLEPSDELLVNIDGYTATGDLRVYYDYNMEEIR